MKPSELLAKLRTLRNPLIAIGGGFAFIEHHGNVDRGYHMDEMFIVNDEARLKMWCVAHDISWRTAKNIPAWI